jgi:hypothetical protein
MPSIDIILFSSIEDASEEVADVLDLDDTKFGYKVNLSKLKKYVNFYVMIEERFENRTKQILRSDMVHCTEEMFGH